MQKPPTSPLFTSWMLTASANLVLSEESANSQSVPSKYTRSPGTIAVPDNTVGVEYAHIYSAAEAVGGATTFAITVSGAADGEQWDATTQDATLTGPTASGANADEIHRFTVTTGFDAAGVIESDNLIGFHCIYAGGQTDVVMGLSLQIVWLVV